MKRYQSNWLLYRYWFIMLLQETCPSTDVISEPLLIFLVAFTLKPLPLDDLYREVKFPSPTCVSVQKVTLLRDYKLHPFRHKELFYKLDLHLASRAEVVLMKRTTKQRRLLVCFRTIHEAEYAMSEAIADYSRPSQLRFLFRSFSTWTSHFLLRIYGLDFETRALRWLSNDMFLNRKQLIVTNGRGSPWSRCGLPQPP